MFHELLFDLRFHHLIRYDARTVEVMSLTCLLEAQQQRAVGRKVTSPPAVITQTLQYGLHDLYFISRATEDNTTPSPEQNTVFTLAIARMSSPGGVLSCVV